MTTASRSAESIINAARTLSEIAYDHHNSSAAGYALKAIRLAQDAETEYERTTAMMFVECARQAILNSHPEPTGSIDDVSLEDAP